MRSRATQSAMARIALWPIFCFIQFVSAAPYRPLRDDEIVETLPKGAATSRELQREQTALASTPEDLRAVLGSARKFVELGQSESDPRYYGYAQAVLKPWWDATNPPALRVMRARIAQFRHQFPAAVSDLKAALATDPGNADAWLLLASIEQVIGDFNGARSACVKLLALSSRLVSSTCTAAVGSLTGQADNSAALLERALQSSSDEPATRVWAWTTLAEIHTRRGDPIAAEAAFRSALAIRPEDVYTLAAYADLLLDNQRAADVVVLLDGNRRADALLLRLALATDALRRPDAGALRDELDQRFSEARERGDYAHQREQAIYRLQLVHDAPDALALAQNNWKTQREPADARILLAAALAAQQTAAARPVLEWMATNRIEDVHLSALASALLKASGP